MYQRQKQKDHMFQFRQHHLHKHPLRYRIIFYIVTFAILAAVAGAFGSGFKTLIPHDLGTVFQRISLSTLLLYALFTFIRLFIAYCVGLIFTFFVLLIIAPRKRLENFFMPIFDILQSVPVLAFFPLIIVAFAQLHLPEVAAQVVLIVAMSWAVLFGALGGTHQIPLEIYEASKIYGATRFNTFFKIVLPAIFPNLVTGSILSWGAGWNVIIISEYINYGRISIRLPGLGSLLSSSAGNDTGVFVIALIILVILISVINRLLWHPLLEYTEKFKFE